MHHSASSIQNKIPPAQQQQQQQQQQFPPKSRDSHYQILYDRLREENDTLRQHVSAAKHRQKTEQAETVLNKWQEKRKTLESKKLHEAEKNPSPIVAKKKDVLFQVDLDDQSSRYIFQPFQISTTSKSPEANANTLKSKDSTLFDYKKQINNNQPSEVPTLKTKKKTPSSIRLSKVGESKRGGLIFKPNVSQPYIP